MRLTSACCLLAAAVCAVPAGEPAADGWTGPASAWTLTGSTPIAVAVAVVEVPAGIGPSTEARLTVAGGGAPVTATQALRPGRHELRAVVGAGATAACAIGLSWSRTMVLPAPDGRTVAARVLRVALEPVAAAPSGWSADADIVATGGPIGLGAGWQPLETWQGDRFRWIGGTVELALAAAGSAGTATLTLDAEPGPGTGGRPARLAIADRHGRQIDVVEVAGRQRADLLIPAAALAEQPLRLRVLNGGAATTGDPRILDLRVLRLTWTP